MNVFRNRNSDFTRAPWVIAASWSSLLAASSTQKRGQYVRNKNKVLKNLSLQRYLRGSGVPGSSGRCAVCILIESWSNCLCIMLLREPRSKFELERFIAFFYCALRDMTSIMTISEEAIFIITDTVMRLIWICSWCEAEMNFRRGLHLEGCYKHLKFEYNLGTTWNMEFLTKFIEIRSASQEETSICAKTDFIFGCA